jgi:Dolichyl-phosphate-mannose-protein mannosyltransferase
VKAVSSTRPGADRPGFGAALPGQCGSRAADERAARRADGWSAEEDGDDFFDPDSIATMLIPRIPSDLRPMESHKPAPPPPDPAQAGHRGPGARLRALPWLLFLILAVQGALSARLLRHGTVLPGEATYLDASHEELAHWRHGAPMPDYAAHFPGAPVLYPPLAALADHVGALAAARLVSLAFMLAATVFLWSTARRLHSDIAAFGGCAAFVALGATQSLGAIATSDAMALCLMAACAYFAVRAALAERHWIPWLPLAASALVLGNATKYATALWDPFIVLLFFIALGRLGSGRKALIRAFFLVIAFFVVLGGAVAAGGRAYVTAIRTATLDRAPGSGPSRPVLIEDVKSWIGWVLLLCLAGIVAAILRSEWGNTLTALVCLLAACAAPAAQFRIDVLGSLVDNVDFGAWFGCLAVGYLVHVLANVMITAKEARFIGVVLTCGMVWLVGAGGLAQSAQYMNSWPVTNNLAAAVAPDVSHGSQRYLVEDDSVLQYDLRGSSSWQQWQNTGSLTFYDPRQGRTVGGAKAYDAAVTDHYFSLIILDGQATPSVDAEIVHTMAECDASCGYQLIAIVPYQGTTVAGHFTVWQYKGAAT